MQAKHQNEIVETVESLSEPSNKQINSARRKVIKKSMQLAAAAYVAPVTLQLLTATRATAQSADVAAPVNCTCSVIDVTAVGVYTSMHLHYIPCGQTSETSLDVFNTTVSISVEPNTNIIAVANFNGTTTISTWSGSIGSVTDNSTGSVTISVDSCGPGAFTGTAYRA